MVLLDNGGRHGSEVTLVAPPEDLAALVEHTSIQGLYPAGARLWRVVADASPHLSATVTEREGRRALRVMVVGARSSAATIDVSHRVLTVAVRLRPGALPALTSTSARELTDGAVPLADAVRGDLLRGLELSADAPPALIAGELARLLRRAARRDLSSWPLRETRSGAVTRLAASAGTTTRALLDRAYRQVGLSPRRLLRIARLHAALHAARGVPRSWADVACAAGYSDQAHFCRDLRALLGETPSAWAARGSARIDDSEG